MPDMPITGILEWFRFQDHEQVERTLADLKSLGVEHLRTGLSWADWHRPDAPEWFDWLVFGAMRLARCNHPVMRGKAFNIGVSQGNVQSIYQTTHWHPHENHRNDLRTLHDWLLHDHRVGNIHFAATGVRP